MDHHVYAQNAEFERRVRAAMPETFNYSTGATNSDRKRLHALEQRIKRLENCVEDLLTVLEDVGMVDVMDPDYVHSPS